jgi:hypothetical protein
MVNRICVTNKHICASKYNIRISSKPTSASYLYLKILEMGKIRICIVHNWGTMLVDNQHSNTSGQHWSKSTIHPSWCTSDYWLTLACFIIQPKLCFFFQFFAFENLVKFQKRLAKLVKIYT